MDGSLVIYIQVMKGSTTFHFDPECSLPLYSSILRLRIKAVTGLNLGLLLGSTSEVMSGGHFANVNHKFLWTRVTS